jgi:predicted O-methyltransferase YrrM
MAEGLSPLTAFWYQGIEALLQGDEALAQELWMPAMLECRVDEVAERTGELVAVLEGSVVELLQAGNLGGAKKCYEMIFEVDETFENATLDQVLGWRLLKPGDIMIFDDYEWGVYRDQPTLQPKFAINSFLEVFQDQVRVIYKDCQVILQKNGVI